MATIPTTAMKFDIVADPSSFNQAVATAQQNWIKATQEMQAAVSPVGTALTAIAAGGAEVFQSLGESLSKAFTGGAAAAEAETIKAFDAIKAQANSQIQNGFESLGERWLGKWGSSIGWAVGNVAKSAVDPATESMLKLSDSIVSTTKIEELAQSFRSMSGDAQGAAESANDLASKIAAMMEGFASARDVMLGRAMAINDFKAITDEIDKQIKKQEQLTQLIGRSAGERAKMQARWAAEEVEGFEKMNDKQTDKYEGRIDQLGSSADNREARQKAFEDGKAFEHMTNQFERQIVLAEARTKEFGKSKGEIAEERTIQDAIARAQARNNTLTAEQLDYVTDIAHQQRIATDNAERENFVRQNMLATGRQMGSMQTQRQTLGMDPADVVRITKFNEEMERARQNQVKLTSEEVSAIQARARSLGLEAQALAEAKDRMNDLREAGQVVARSLESAFDKFASGTKVTFSEMVSSMLTDMAKLAFKQSIIQPLFGGNSANPNGLVGNWLGGLINGARADGGPVSSSGTYLVGENGPELFTPNSAGNITPNGQFGGGSQSNITVHLNAQGATTEALPMLQRQVAELRATLPSLVMQTMGDARERGMMA